MYGRPWRASWEGAHPIREILHDLAQDTGLPWDRYLSLEGNRTMSTMRATAMNYLPKAALALCALGVVGIPLSLVMEQEWALPFPGVSLSVGVLLALVFGLASASASATVVKWCMVLYVVGMVFKFLRYPGASAMMFIAFGVPMVLFLLGTLAMPFRYKGNLFLILVGGAAGLVLIAGYFATLSRMMYWPNSDLLFTLFAPGYVVVTIALLVGIQITDFVQWDPAPRRYLTNNILVPWAFLFLVGGSILLLPKQYFKFVGGETDWGMMHEAQAEDL
jgi:hypothetical protein